MFKKIIGLGLALTLGFGIVGCSSTVEEQQQEVQQEEQYVEEQPQQEEKEYEQPKEEYRQEEKYQEPREEIKDEDVSDYYIENRQKTDLEIAKEGIEEEFRANGLNSQIQIDEENNLIIITQYFSLNEIAQAIANGTWGELASSMQKLSLRYHQQYGVNVGFIVGATDNGNAYLGVINGEIAYNVEDELN